MPLIKAEHPILFSAPMVRGLLDGRKMQTRRILKSQPTGPFLGLLERSLKSRNDEPRLRAWFGSGPGENTSTEINFPYGNTGHSLWVRENSLPDFPKEFSYYDWSWREVPDKYRSPEHVIYQATWDGSPLSFHPSIHMPRWACRIEREITEVRVERLLDISAEDALAEGIYFDKIGFTAGHMGGLSGVNQEWSATPVIAFKNLWRALNGRESLDANPWVWVVSFKQVGP
jgi:hypothetical protein